MVLPVGGGGGGQTKVLSGLGKCPGTNTKEVLYDYDYDCHNQC